MEPVHPATVRENADDDATDLVPRLLNAVVTASHALAFCECCRVRGILALLIDGDATRFQRDLGRSGRAMAHALARIPEPAKVTSALKPFFDAIAAGDFEGARAIAMLARATWNEEEEYEDDFLYVHFLMRHLFLGADPAESERILAQWEGVLEGGDDVRLDLARAIAARDAAAFEAAFAGVLDAEKARYAMLRKSDALSDAALATEAHVSVEGIALARIARHLGVAIGDEYWGVPSLALGAQPAAIDPEGWKTL